ncbi:MAG: hypothetical protein ACLFNU_08880 [Bacteroidales bacterium]
MRRKFLGFITLLAAVLVIAACSKDDTPEPLTKDEAVTKLNDASDEMDQGMTEMMQTEGMNAMMYFMNIAPQGTEVKSGESSKAAINNLKQIVDFARTPKKAIVPKAIKVAQEFDTPFGNYGTFTFNETTYQWDYSSEPQDEIVYIFPADATGEKLATLTISGIEVVGEGEDEFLTVVSILLEVDGDEALLLTYSATITDDIMESVEVDLTMEEFTFSLNASMVELATGIKVNFSHSIKNAGLVLMSSNLEMLFPEFDMTFDPSMEDDMLDDTEPKTVNGHLVLGSIKATLDLNNEAFISDMSSGVDMETAANDHLNIRLYSYPEGASIAYVKWYEVDNDIEPYLVFSDNSEQPAEDYFPDDMFEDF